MPLYSWACMDAMASAAVISLPLLGALSLAKSAMALSRLACPCPTSSTSFEAASTMRRFSHSPRTSAA